jgi:hypothetical protein
MFDLAAHHRELAELRAANLALEARVLCHGQFARQLLFAALLCRRDETVRLAVEGALAGRLGTGEAADGIRRLALVTLTLPSCAAHAPSLALLRHESEHVTRWALEWAPPAGELAATIAVEAAVFGRAVEGTATLSDLRLTGELRLAVEPCAGDAGEVAVSFCKPPALDFKLGLPAGAGGAALGVALKPLLSRQLGKALAAVAVEPARLRRRLPGAPAAPPPPSPLRGADAAAADDGARGGAAPNAAELAAAAEPRLCALLALRRAGDGLWPLDSRVAVALGVQLSALLVRMPSELEDAMIQEGGDADAPSALMWASALALAALRLRHHDALNAWQHLAEAAERLPVSVRAAAMEAFLALGLNAPATPGEEI